MSNSAWVCVIREKVRSLVYGEAASPCRRPPCRFVIRDLATWLAGRVSRNEKTRRMLSFRCRQRMTVHRTLLQDLPADLDLDARFVALYLDLKLEVHFIRYINTQLDSFAH